MDSFFGTPWADLQLSDVERFLSEEAEAEGLTWEAKGADPRGGNDRPHRDAVRKHTSAFANSESGGFYILGASRAERNAGPWKLDPLDFGDDEPTTWLSRVVRGGVNPVPPYDVHEWEINGRHVAVLRIDPVSEPPCITMAGGVFTRVSGESVPVTDAETLSRLYARGRERVERAMRYARYAAKPETDFGIPRVRSEPAELRLRVGFTPVGVDSTTDARILRRSFAERALEAARALPAASLFPYPGQAEFAVEMTRRSIVVAEATEGNRQRWRIEVETDATITVVHTVTVDPGEAQLLARAVVEDAIRPAIQTATQIAVDTGASGRGYLVVSLVGRAFELRDERGRWGDVPGIPNFSITRATEPREYRGGIEAWVDVGSEPSAELTAMIEREILRGCGITAWEPEPDDELAHGESADG